MKIAFYLLAIWTMTSGLFAVTQRNMVYCTIALTAFFLGIAGIFFTLHAEFLGAVQILVYVGAVTILILFGIMLTQQNLEEKKSTSPLESLYGWIFSLGILGLLVYGLSHWDTSTLQTESSSITLLKIGQSMMNNFAIPFELISILLTVALIGALILANDGKVTEPTQNKTSSIVPPRSSTISPSPIPPKN